MRSNVKKLLVKASTTSVSGQIGSALHYLHCVICNKDMCLVALMSPAYSLHQQRFPHIYIWEFNT